MYPYLHIFGSSVPTYGAMMALGLLLSGIIGGVRVKRSGQSVDDYILMVACGVGVAILCGGLLFIFTAYSFSLIWKLITAGKFYMIFSGGIVFYGALFGGIIGAFIGSRILKNDMSNFLDAAIPAIPIGQAVGRIGCFCAGCCFGKPTNSFLGVIYENPVGGAPRGVKLLPVQLFESGADVLIFVALILVSRKAKSKYTTTYLYCILYGTVRFILEYFRYDSIRGEVLGLSTSQWISLALILGALSHFVITHIKGTGAVK